MAHEIFVSYSQSDRDCALELTQHIEAEGFSVWIAPRDVSAGADWAAQIIEALSAARVMVLVLSGSSNESPQVRREVERAVHKQLHVLPFRIEDVLPSRSLEYFLSAEHWLDAFPPPREPYYAQLCAHLRSLLSTAAATGAAASTTRSARAFSSRNVAGARLNRSVAVLPFVNLSSDPEQEYFSDGLSEELINHLAHIKGLRVIARTSCFAFKGKNEDLRAVGEKLSVGQVLEGSVRKAGNRLRISAQLIECADGSHLWSETFDRELGDVFAMQDDIARRVAQALGITLGIEEEVRAPGGTTNLEAYDLYLRARALAHQLGPVEITRAVELYRAALALDANFALGWSALAEALYWTTIYVPEESGVARKALDEAVVRALCNAPDLWETHYARGMQELMHYNWAAAERSLATALAVAPPNQPEVPFYVGWLQLQTGRAKEAAGLLEAARRLDPLSLTSISIAQASLISCGRFDDAEAEYRRGMDVTGDRENLEHHALCCAVARGNPQAVKAQMQRFLAHQSIPMPVLEEVSTLVGDPVAARAKLRKAFDDPGNQDATRQFKLAIWAALFGDVELSLDALQKAYVVGRSSVLYVIWLPVMEPVRKHPRFKHLLRDLGIADYWRQTGHWGDFARPLGDADFEIIR